MLTQRLARLGCLAGLTAVLMAPGCGGGKAHPPIIARISVNPTVLPGGGGEITISARVIDRESSAVQAVFAEITRPDGTVEQVALLRVSGDAREGDYEGVFQVPVNPGGEAQSYRIVVKARDAAMTVSRPAQAGMVTVAPGGGIANQPPVVDAAAVQPALLPPAGGLLTITATVSDADAAAVAAVFAEITRPDGALERVTLDRVGGDAASGSYQGAFNLPANPEAGDRLYRVEVAARDAAAALSAPVNAGNVVVEGAAPVNQPPAITQASARPVSLPAGGGQVTLTATVVDSDADAVAAVTARLTRPGGGTETFALDRVAGDASNGSYQATQDLPANPGTTAQVYEFVVHARDVAGAEASPARAGAVVVAGSGTATNQPPVVTQAAVSPGELSMLGGAITIAAVVVDGDADAVESVFAEIMRPDGSLQRIDLSRTAGDAGDGSYRGTVALPGNPEPVSKTYQVVVGARDRAQAVAIPRSAGSVTVAGPAAPPPPPPR